jgi:hypothetical protein
MADPGAESKDRCETSLRRKTRKMASGTFPDPAGRKAFAR